MSDSIKQRNQARFGDFAAGYVNSAVHADEADLQRLREVAQPQAAWRVLDIATGGGHTALAFAPYVAQVVASDLTGRMLHAAREHIQAQGASNVTFSRADAEQLPFASASFDCVTCRIAAHHFPQAFRFVMEAARVLRSGGVLVVQDHLVSDDERVARYTEAFEKLRDPSHVRAFSQIEWRGMFLDAGMSIDHTEAIEKRHHLQTWAARQGCSPDVVERLQVMLLRAPEAAAVWLQPEYAGTEHATFGSQHLVIAGRKE